MLRIKSTARLIGLKPEIVIGILIVYSVFEDSGLDCEITSGPDSVHEVGSLHYSGNAVDFKSKHVNLDKKHIILSNIKEALGLDFDAILENVGQDKEHYHIEYQPKISY